MKELKFCKSVVKTEGYWVVVAMWDSLGREVEYGEAETDSVWLMFADAAERTIELNAGK